MNETEYIAYFENLATQHKALRHSPTEKHFFVISEGSKAELTEAIRTLRYPILLLDQYMDDLDTAQDNFRDRLLGGLTVLVQLQKGDPADKRRARTEARDIARSMLKRMRLDALRGVLAQRSIKIDPEFKGEPAPGIVPGADGWGYSFDWWLPTQVKVDQTEWLDLEQG